MKYPCFTRVNWTFLLLLCVATLQAQNTFTGVANGVVTLDDREDHTWSYYQPAASCPDGIDKLHSPQPRNVQITYHAGSVTSGSTKSQAWVSINEQDSMFVYYKTIEKVGGKYAYELIPNPFSKRPSIGSGNSKQYYGCRKWRLTSVTGGKVYNGTTELTAGTTNGSLIDAETEINFVPNDEDGTGYVANGTSMQVVFTAYWEPAKVQVSNGGSPTWTNLTGGHYELNFVVVNCSTGVAVNNFASTTAPFTLTMVMPDGSADYRGNGGYLNGDFTNDHNDVKFEYINIRGASVYNGQRKYFALGRGITRGDSQANFGTYALGSRISNVCITRVEGGRITNNNENASYNQKMRVESGRYEQIFMITNGGNSGNSGTMKTSNECHLKLTCGCDYDRAKTNGNQNLYVAGLWVSNGAGMSECVSLSPNVGLHNINSTFRFVGLSGIYGAPDQLNRYIYLSSHPGGSSPSRVYCKRYGEFWGGEYHDIAGGADRIASDDNTTKAYTNTDVVFMRFRKDAVVKQAIFGGATSNLCGGNRVFIFTGGTFHGWIAGGANCFDNGDKGFMHGNSYIYFGGGANMQHQDENGLYPSSSRNDNGRKVHKKGNIFGAAAGNSSADVGLVYNTNIILADQSLVSRNVFGGGDWGYVDGMPDNNSADNNFARIYIYGGTVQGNVFGGSNEQKGKNSLIRMTGGTVIGGIYGGANTNGTMSGNTTINITGGTVGAVDAAKAHVCGGGFGYQTRVTGNVDVTVGGTANVVNGDIYGGSEQGLVNGESASNSGANPKHTNVTITGQCTITGNVYGGGLGVKAATGVTAREANTYGLSTVTISGGTVNGNVFGCNNQNGRPIDPNVKLNMTSGTVNGHLFGGGNQASYTGNTHVSVTGGTVTKNVYGGGYGTEATVNGNTNVIIGE